MNKKIIKQRLKSEAASSTPDVLDSVLSTIDKGSNTTTIATEIPVARKRSSFRWIGMAAAFVAVMAVAMYSYVTQNAVASVIGIDVNPSIEISVNSVEKILDITALNADAEIVLADLDLESEELDMAVDIIINSMIEHGYLKTENPILLTVENSDTDRGSEIEKRLASTIKQKFAENPLLSLSYSLTDEISTLADQNEMSNGKAAFIDDMSEQLLDVGFDSLSHQTLKEFLRYENMLEGIRSGHKYGVGLAGNKHMDALIEAGLDQACLDMFVHEIEIADDGRSYDLYSLNITEEALKYLARIDAFNGPLEDLAWSICKDGKTTQPLESELEIAETEPLETEPEAAETEPLETETEVTETEPLETETEAYSGDVETDS